MKTLILTSIFSLIIIASSAQTYRGSSPVTPEQQLNEQYCTGLFKSAEGTILDVLDNPSAAGYINILDWLNSRVAGLQIYITRSGTRIPIIRGSQARIFLNEMPIDAVFINSIPIADIAMIKVIKQPFAGSFGNAPAVAIYTIQPEEEEEEEGK
jgi:hypothetical protein